MSCNTRPAWSPMQDRLCIGVIPRAVPEFHCQFPGPVRSHNGLSDLIADPAGRRPSNQAPAGVGSAGILSYLPGRQRRGESGVRPPVKLASPGTCVMPRQSLTVNSKVFRHFGCPSGERFWHRDLIKGAVDLDAIEKGGVVSKARTMTGYASAECLFIWDWQHQAACSGVQRRKIISASIWMIG